MAKNRKGEMLGDKNKDSHLLTLSPISQPSQCHITHISLALQLPTQRLGLLVLCSQLVTLALHDLQLLSKCLTLHTTVVATPLLPFAAQLFTSLAQLWEDDK